MQKKASESCCSQRPVAEKVGFEPTGPVKGLLDFESLEMTFLGCPTVAFVSTWKRRKSLILCGFGGTHPMATRLLKKLAFCRFSEKV